MAQETSHQTLQALLRELKSPLTSIARQAELLEIPDIAHQASGAMSLIDGFLLSAQTDYGQTQLPLEPISVGSIMYRVSIDSRRLARENNVVIDSSVSQDNLIMTHRRGLEVGLGCLLQLALQDTSTIEASDQRKVGLISYQRRDGRIVAGVLSDNLEMSQSDLKRSEILQGISHQAAATHVGGSGVQLVIAQQLARSLGAPLMSLKKNGRRGLGFELLKSQQLSLV